MKRNIIYIILILITITGCISKKETKDIEIKTNIKIGEKKEINQLEKIGITNTSDYLIITENRDFSDIGRGYSQLTVPYTINVKGKDYKGICILGNNIKEGNDKNPKYIVTISNLKNENGIYTAEVLISKKSIFRKIKEMFKKN